MNEKKFIKDILGSKDTNDTLRKRYKFESNREMLNKFDELRKTHNIKIKNKCSKSQAKNMRIALNSCLEILKKK